MPHLWGRYKHVSILISVSYQCYQNGMFQFSWNGSQSKKNSIKWNHPFLKDILLPNQKLSAWNRNNWLEIYGLCYAWNQARMGIGNILPAWATIRPTPCQYGPLCTYLHCWSLARLQQGWAAQAEYSRFCSEGEDCREDGHYDTALCYKPLCLIRLLPSKSAPLAVGCWP